jgi:signal peptidase II
MTSFVRTGILVAIATLLADQAIKLYLLFVVDIATRGAIRLTPFFDLVLTWNRGISYGWFQAETASAQAILLLIKVVAITALAVWLWRAHNRIVALGLGLIIGGAIGNGIDNIAYGAVMDFAFFHLQWGDFRFNWYVFNLADAAIVAGVLALLYDSILGSPAAKAP